jgi:predicted dehydrogenase
MAPDDSKITRRDFVKGSASVAAGFAVGPMIVPRHVLGRGFVAPSDTLNVAMVGVGGMGKENMFQLVNAGANIVAICDADWGYVERAMANRFRPAQGQTELTPQLQNAKAAFEKAKRYTDFRRMLDEQKDIDAVSIATPDHLHAVIAYAAMKHGKHVYVQKPMTYSVLESRILAKTARDMKVTTQMGNQGHSMDGTRRLVELINAGVIGPVREVHVWTDRPQRYWAQGIPRPAVPAPASPTPAAAPAAPAPNPNPAPPSWNVRTVERAVLAAMASNPQDIPRGLEWDLFLGPAKEMPYHPAYHPFSWRGWVDFGVSAIGDMGAHLLDQPFWRLDSGCPRA